VLAAIIPHLVSYTFFLKSLIIKLATLNTNEQEAIGSIVADPIAYVISISPIRGPLSRRSLLKLVNSPRS